MILRVKFLFNQKSRQSFGSVKRKDLKKAIDFHDVLLKINYYFRVLEFQAISSILLTICISIRRLLGLIRQRWLRRRTIWVWEAKYHREVFLKQRIRGKRFRGYNGRVNGRRFLLHQKIYPCVAFRRTGHPRFASYTNACKGCCLNMPDLLALLRSNRRLIHIVKTWVSVVVECAESN